MDRQAFLNKMGTGLEKTWDKVAQIVTGSKEDWQIGVQPYRTYGTSHHVYYACRVLRQTQQTKPSIHDSAWTNLKSAFHHFESDEIPGAGLTVSIAGISKSVITDEEGYATGMIELSEPLDAGWHDIDVTIDKLPFGATIRDGYQLKCLVPSEMARFGIISDIDDTILHSQVTNRFKMALWAMLHNAYTRLPLPGVPRLYRKLAEVSGQESINPVFYVSSSPWNLYPMLEEFIRVMDLPKGPIQLRDLGIGEDSTLIGGHGHKRDKIERILETYPDLEFLLLGDSGQHDAEIYGQIAEDYPERILAIYIRDVGVFEQQMFEKAQQQANAAGIPMVHASDSDEIAQHAAMNGWMEDRTLEFLSPV